MLVYINEQHKRTTVAFTNPCLCADFSDLADLADRSFAVVTVDIILHKAKSQDQGG